MKEAKNYKEYYRSKEFKEQYIYDGNDLGACCTANSTSFKIWSPLAKSVTLNLYKDGDNKSKADKIFPMKREKKAYGTTR